MTPAADRERLQAELSSEKQSLEKTRGDIAAVMEELRELHHLERQPYKSQAETVAYRLNILGQSEKHHTNQIDILEQQLATLDVSSSRQ